MTLLTDKDLKSKCFRGKKVYILAKDIDLKSKSNKFRLVKVTLIQVMCPKRLDSLTKYFSVYKILVP